MTSTPFSSLQPPTPSPNRSELQKVQAKLNRLMKSFLLRGPVIPELGILDAATIGAMERFVKTYAIHSPKSFVPFVHLEPQRKPERMPVAVPLPLPKVCVSLPKFEFGLTGKAPAYDPLPDLLPWSHALRVLPWLTDHSPGRLSEMTKQSLIELANKMVPHAKRDKVTAGAATIVDALINAQRTFGADLDSTDWYLMAIATVRAETGNFVPRSEGVDYNSAHNNSAYEDFDVYEPYYVYAPDKADELIQASRQKAQKKQGAAFEEPSRNPQTSRKAAEGNTQPGDGARFRGRGFGQLTHRSVRKGDTLWMREAVNGFSKKGLPAGMGEFDLGASLEPVCTKLCELCREG